MLMPGNLKAEKIDAEHYRFCVLDDVVIYDEYAKNFLDQGLLGLNSDNWYLDSNSGIKELDSGLYWYKFFCSDVHSCNGWSNLWHRYENKYVSTGFFYTYFYIEIVAPTGVSISNLSKDIVEVGESESFIVKPAGDFPKFEGKGYFTYSVTSTDPNVLIVKDLGNQKYEIEAKNPGTASIRAQVKIKNSNYPQYGTYDLGAAYKSITVKEPVKEIYVNKIELNQYNLSLTEGESQELKASIYPSDATNQSVEWSSSNPSVASVDDNGNVTAKSAGSATITCSALDGSGVTATCAVTVKAKTVDVESVTLSPTSKVMKAGESFKISAEVSPADATDKTLKWESSDKSVATVDGYGNVKAKSTGTATITCTASGGVSAKCMVSVLPVNPIPASMIEGNYTFFLGDYFRGEDSSGMFVENGSISISGNAALLEIDTFEDLDVLADYDEESGSLIFTTRALGEVTDDDESYYCRFEPIVCNEEGRAIPTDYFISYDKTRGAFVFPEDYGFSWVAYEDAECTELVGYFGTYIVPCLMKDTKDDGKWTDYDTATYVDGWMLPGFGYDPKDNPWKVSVQQNTENPSLFRINNPYASDGCPIKDNVIGTGYIVFDLSDPENVMVPFGNYCGIMSGTDMFEATNPLGYCWNMYEGKYESYAELQNEITSNWGYSASHYDKETGTVKFNDCRFTYPNEEGLYIWRDKESWMNGYLVFDNKHPGNINVESISLPSTLTLMEGSGDWIYIDVSPDNATDKTLTYTSSDPSVATIDWNDKLGWMWVDAISAGKTILTATANDGSGVSATCEIEVYKSENDKEFEYEGMMYTVIDKENKTCATKTIEGNYDPSQTATGDFKIPANVYNGNVLYTVTEIGESSFAGLTNLTSVNFPNSVTAIKDGAFSGCAGLTFVYIPANVSQIGRNPFSACENLDDIAVASTNQYFVSVDGCLFNKPMTLLIGCPGAKYDDYTIPTTVTEIGGCAFNGCRNLVSVEIPGSVVAIGNGAFAECGNLSEINYNTTEPIVAAKDVFDDTKYRTAVLNIAIGGLGKAKVTAPWKYFSNIQEKDFSGIREVIADFDEGSVKIYDMEGRLVQTSVKDLAPGLYIIFKDGRSHKIMITK